MNRYYINPQNNLLTQVRTDDGSPAGVEGVDWLEVLVPIPSDNWGDWTWNPSLEQWDYTPYIPPYQPQCLISVVDEQGNILPDEGKIEAVLVIKEDGTKSVKVRNVTDNGNGTWTLGPIL